MHNLQYWGERLNWVLLAWLGVAAVLLFLARVLTVAAYIRRLHETLGENPDENDAKTMERAQALFSATTPIVPAKISGLYFLSGLTFIGVTLWGTVRTAWWFLPLGILVWFMVHWPFRDAMRSWTQAQKTWLIKRDADALLKSSLSSDEERRTKDNLGL